MKLLIPLAGLLVVVVAGLLAFHAYVKRETPKQIRAERELYRQFVAGLHSDALRSAEVEPFAVAVIDEINTLHSKLSKETVT